MERLVGISAPFVCISGEWVLSVATSWSEGKAERRDRLIPFRADLFSFDINPGTHFVANRTQRDGVVALRRAGAEIGIPTMASKEDACLSRVKAAIITIQSDGLP
jgi:hypothetical protein